MIFLYKWVIFFRLPFVTLTETLTANLAVLKIGTLSRCDSLIRFGRFGFCTTNLWGGIGGVLCDSEGSLEGISWLYVCVCIMCILCVYIYIFIYLQYIYIYTVYIYIYI